MPPLRRSLKKLAKIFEQEVVRQGQRGRQLRLMFQDEARFGRINDPRRCWARLKRGRKSDLNLLEAGPVYPVTILRDGLAAFPVPSIGFGDSLGTQKKALPMSGKADE